MLQYNLVLGTFSLFLKNLEPLQLQKKGEKSWERGCLRYSRFASLRKAEQRGKKLRSRAFVDFHGITLSSFLKEY